MGQTVEKNDRYLFQNWRLLISSLQYKLDSFSLSVSFSWVLAIFLDMYTRFQLLDGYHGNHPPHDGAREQWKPLKKNRCLLYLACDIYFLVTIKFQLWCMIKWFLAFDSILYSAWFRAPWTIRRQKTISLVQRSPGFIRNKFSSWKSSFIWR